ncbi:LIM domain-containing protein PLIM2c [Linum perenne]
MVFSGTTDKCKACDKTVYFIEMVTADSVLYHRNCFKCSHCNGKLVKNNQNKFAAMFSGTQDKCSSCQKTVYPLEKVSIEGDFFHKTCFRCAHGGCVLTHSSYAALNGVLFCKHHFKQLFREKGSYNHINQKSAALSVEALKGISEKEGNVEEEEESSTPRAPAAEMEPIAQ